MAEEEQIEVVPFRVKAMIHAINKKASAPDVDSHCLDIDNGKFSFCYHLAASRNQIANTFKSLV